MTYSLIASCGHSLSKVDHLVAVRSIIVVEPDQHEPALPGQGSSHCDLEARTHTSNTRVVSVDSSDTKRRSNHSCTSGLVHISTASQRLTISRITTLRHDVDSDRRTCPHFLDYCQPSMSKTGSLGQGTYRDGSSTIPSGRVAASLDIRSPTVKMPFLDMSSCRSCVAEDRQKGE